MSSWTMWSRSSMAADVGHTSGSCIPCSRWVWGWPVVAPDVWGWVTPVLVVSVFYLGWQKERCCNPIKNVWASMHSDFFHEYETYLKQIFAAFLCSIAWSWSPHKPPQSPAAAGQRWRQSLLCHELLVHAVRAIIQFPRHGFMVWLYQ